jgi:hypothetical protein
MDDEDKKRYFAGTAANTRGDKVKYEKPPPKKSNNKRKIEEETRARAKKAEEKAKAGRKARSESASFPFKKGGPVMKSKKPPGSGCCARTKPTKKY